MTKRPANTNPNNNGDDDETKNNKQSPSALANAGFPKANPDLGGPADPTDPLTATHGPMTTANTDIDMPDDPTDPLTATTPKQKPNNSINNLSHSGKNSGAGPSNPTTMSPNMAGSPFHMLPPTNQQQQDEVKDLLIDYNEKATKKQFDNALFRDNVIERSYAVLTQIKHPNVLLIGDAGVGKTQIVEEMANRIVANDPALPKMLKNAHIYELPIANISAGQSFVGQLEEQLQKIIKFAVDPKNHAILYIDEIHQLFDNGKDSTSSTISQTLKPALSRGDMHIIASTTTQEAKSLKTDPAISRRFATVVVPELDKPQTVEIMKAFKTKVEKRHDIKINDNILDKVMYYADEYLKTIHRPDNALTLLDRAAAELQVSISKMQLTGTGKPWLKEKHIKNATTQITNQTPLSVTKKDDIKAELANSIIGQDDALDELSTHIAHKTLQLLRNKKPLSFIFAGPSGNGKTATAKALAKYLFGSEQNLINLNMTEYSDSIALTKLTGATAGYAGYTDHQELPLDRLKTQPRQIVLLDEFEKAHISVQQFFMQALDEGQVTDSRNDIIPFSDAIVIATTNAGVVETPHIGFNGTISKEDKKDVLKAQFPKALLNRFTDIIFYKEIGKDTYKKILKQKYNQIIDELDAESGSPYAHKFAKIDINQDYPVIDEMADATYDPDFNARPAYNTVLNKLESSIMNQKPMIAQPKLTH